MKDWVTKGIDKLSHLAHFINLWSSVIGRIPPRIFLKIPSGKPSEIFSMQGSIWDWQDPRCDPTWDMISQVGNYLKFEAGSQEGWWDSRFNPAWDVMLSGIYGRIPTSIGGIPCGIPCRMFHNPRWDHLGSHLKKVGFLMGHTWDPRWDWQDHTLYFYLGSTGKI